LGDNRKQAGIRSFRPMTHSLEASSGEWAIGWNDRNSTGKPEPYQTNLSDIQWANLSDNQANWSGIQANPSADLPYV